MKKLGFVFAFVVASLFILGQFTVHAGEIKWKAQTSFPPMDSGTVHQAQGMVKFEMKNDIKTEYYHTSKKNFIPFDPFFQYYGFQKTSPEGSCCHACQADRGG